MKRFHVHAHVEDLGRSIDFYSRLFGMVPTRRESDYAKWMLDDPRINFAISTRGGKPGVDHLGIQTDSDEELAAMKAQAEAAGLGLSEVGEASCCYARSDKCWLVDPQGIAWEQFHTLVDIPTFGDEAQPVAGSACCAGAAPRGRPGAAAAKPAGSCC